MPQSITVHTALIVLALSMLACLGWSALSAVWAWITTGGPVPVAAILGGILALLVVVALVAGL